MGALARVPLAMGAFVVGALAVGVLGMGAFAVGAVAVAIVVVFVSTAAVFDDVPLYAGAEHVL